jgi:chromosome segregation ATPase
MSLTDEIYRELLDGLENNLDWQQFVARHSASKGPLYNAIALFFSEVEPKIVSLNKEKSQLQSELDQAGLALDSLDRREKEAESNIKSLEERGNILKGQVETLEAKFLEKSELVERLAELERIGFESERLRQLEEALKEIGMKYGLKGKETIGRFFDDLKDYGAVLEAEVQLKGLQTKIETKKLTAENWQAKEEALRRKHDDLKEAIKAVAALRVKNIKVSQIIAWQQILNRFQAVEQFAGSLTQYGDMTKLLEARREEVESWELRLVKAQSQLESLEKEKTKIGAAIEALKAAGLKELKAMTAETNKQMKTLADMEINEILAVGQEVRAELNDFLTRFDTLHQKVFETGQEYERIRQRLQKYDDIKDILESYIDSSSEEEK